MTVGACGTRGLCVCSSTGGECFVLCVVPPIMWCHHMTTLVLSSSTSLTHPSVLVC